MLLLHWFRLYKYAQGYLYRRNQCSNNMNCLCLSGTNLFGSLYFFISSIKRDVKDQNSLISSLTYCMGYFLWLFDKLTRNEYKKCVILLDDYHSRCPCLKDPTEWIQADCAKCFSIWGTYYAPFPWRLSKKWNSSPQWINRIQKLKSIIWIWHNECSFTSKELPETKKIPAWQNSLRPSRLFYCMSYKLMLIQVSDPENLRLHYKHYFIIKLLFRGIAISEISSSRNNQNS